MRVTESGNVCHLTGEDFKGECTECACPCTRVHVCACETIIHHYNIFLDETWAYSVGQTTHDWITPSYKSPPANHKPVIRSIHGKSGGGLWGWRWRPKCRASTYWWNYFKTFLLNHALNLSLSQFVSGYFSLLLLGTTVSKLRVM